jgi:hypothetical protein
VEALPILRIPFGVVTVLLTFSMCFAVRRSGQYDQMIARAAGFMASRKWRAYCGPRLRPALTPEPAPPLSGDSLIGQPTGFAVSVDGFDLFVDGVPAAPGVAAPSAAC